MTKQTKQPATFEGAPIVQSYKINLAFAAAVARELGDGWALRPATAIELEDDGPAATHRQSPHLDGPDGVGVYLTSRYEGGAERTTVHGDGWSVVRSRRGNSTSGYSFPSSSIGVDFARGPAAVAKAIRSRLLPDFVPALRDLRARLDAEDTIAATIDREARELERTCHLRRWNNRRDDRITAPAVLRRELPAGVVVEATIDEGGARLSVSGLSHDALRSLLVHLGAERPAPWTEADARELEDARSYVDGFERAQDGFRELGAERRRARIVELETARGAWAAWTAKGGK